MAGPPFDLNALSTLWNLSNQMDTLEASKKPIKDLYIRTVGEPGKEALEVHYEGGNLFTRFINWCTRLRQKECYLLMSGDEKQHTKTAEKLHFLKESIATVGNNEDALRQALILEAQKGKKTALQGLTEKNVEAAVTSIITNCKKLNAILQKAQNAKVTRNPATEKKTNALFAYIKLPEWTKAPASAIPAGIRSSPRLAQESIAQGKAAPVEASANQRVPAKIAEAPAPSPEKKLLDEIGLELGAAKTFAAEAAEIGKSGTTQLDFVNVEIAFGGAWDEEKKASQALDTLRKRLGAPSSDEAQAYIKKAEGMFNDIQKVVDQAFYDYTQVQARLEAEEIVEPPAPVATKFEKLGAKGKQFAADLQKLELCVDRRLLPVSYSDVKNIINEARKQVQKAFETYPDDTAKMNQLVDTLSKKFGDKKIQNILTKLQELFPYLALLDGAIQSCPDNQLKGRLKAFAHDYKIFAPSILQGLCRLDVAAIRQIQAGRLANFLDLAENQSLKKQLYATRVDPELREVARFVKQLTPRT